MRVRRQLRMLQIAVAVLVLAFAALAWKVFAPPPNDPASDALDAAAAANDAVAYSIIDDAGAETGGEYQPPEIALEAPPQPAVSIETIRRIEHELNAVRAEAKDAKDRADKAYDKALEPCLVYSQFC